LRCACLTYVGQVRGRSDEEQALRTAAKHDFATASLRPI
jgi:hypothetical protein